MSAADPTKEFIDRLNDPSQWVIRSAVPIFKPHEQAFPEMKLSNGQVIPARVNKVTAEDLAEIASNMAHSEKSGTYALIRIGHINPDPGAPEHLQPKVAGVYRNPRVGTFGPNNEPCLLADEYLLPELAPDRKNYPHRSSEYYGVRKTIKGVALLSRPPALDLGMVGFHEGEFPYHYAMGPTNATNAAVGDKPEEEYTPEQKALYEGMRRYCVKTFGLDQSWPGTTPAPQEGDTVADDKTPKGDAGKSGDKDGPVTPMQAPDVATLYAQFETFKVQSATNEAALRAQLQGLTLERDHERCQAMVQTLVSENYALAPEEVTKEVAKLAKLPIAERDERMQEVRAIYADRKVPSGGMIDLYDGRNEPGNPSDPNDPYAAPSYHEAAMLYMMQHVGTSYAAACQHVQATAVKK